MSKRLRFCPHCGVEISSAFRMWLADVKRRERLKMPAARRRDIAASGGRAKAARQAARKGER